MLLSYLSISWILPNRWIPSFASSPSSRKLNFTMARTMGKMKDPATPFDKYINQDKLYISPDALGRVDIRIIGVMVHTDPQLTFRDDIKAAIMDIMSDKKELSVFAKYVKELNTSLDNPSFTNGLAIQMAIKDGKETEAYTEKHK
jgi:hypothetical protein